MEDNEIIELYHQGKGIQARKCAHKVIQYRCSGTPSTLISLCALAEVTRRLVRLVTRTPLLCRERKSL